MSWTYIIPTGEMLDPAGNLAGTGYAGGECGKFPDAINNPGVIAVHNVGPLPPGRYTLAEMVRNSHLGPVAIRLEPDPANEMYGRGGFFIHLDTPQPRCASDGCIVQAFAIINAMWESADHELNVLLKVPVNQIVMPDAE